MARSVWWATCIIMAELSDLSYRDTVLATQNLLQLRSTESRSITAFSSNMEKVKNVVKEATSATPQFAQGTFYDYS